MQSEVCRGRQRNKAEQQECESPSVPGDRPRKAMAEDEVDSSAWGILGVRPCHCPGGDSPPRAGGIPAQGRGSRGRVAAVLKTAPDRSLSDSLSRNSSL